MTADTILFLKTGYSQAHLRDSVRHFGMYCSKVPFSVGGEAKELSSTSYPDESGEDEYVPPTIPMKAYEMTVKFAYKGRLGDANTAVRQFIDYLTGRDGTGAEFSMYSTHSRIGRRKVRVVKVHDEAELVRDVNGDILLIDITFKVNDPVTDVEIFNAAPQKIVDLRQS